MTHVDQIFPYFRGTEEFKPPEVFTARYGKDVRYFGVREATKVTDWDEWNGRCVLIQGVGLVRVLATERFAHASPWREGEAIGFIGRLIEPISGAPKGPGGQ